MRIAVCTLRRLTPSSKVVTSTQQIADVVIGEGLARERRPRVYQDNNAFDAESVAAVSRCIVGLTRLTKLDMVRPTHMLSKREM